ncbi:MAG TPA: hypothetical protein ENN08_07740 [Bacteroidales bacterium]|nr:hypothetical protein [Bacteroidales bacterium]
MKRILLIFVMTFLASGIQAQEKPVNKEKKIKLVELSTEGMAKEINAELSASPVSGFTTNAEPNTKNDPVILNYDQNPFTAIGLSDGGIFSVAARFPADMIAPYIDYELVSVNVYIWDFPFSCQIRIWGAGTSTTPGILLHQQSIVPSTNSWNLVELSNPVALDGNDIWIGYTVGHYSGQFPAGCDSGPAHPEGAWISTNNVNWYRLYQIAPDLSFNWNIRGYLLQGFILALDEEFLIDDSVFGNNDGILDPGETASLTMTVANNGNDDLYDIQSALSSADTLIMVNSAVHTIPVLPAGSTASVVFSVTAHEATPYGYPVELEVIATDLIPGL